MRKKGLYTVIRPGWKSLAALISALIAAAFLAVTAFGESSDEIELPVIMYHSVLKDEKYQGQYVISPEDFESDMKWLSENGYTTVLVSDLIEYTKGGSLPEKPVLLSFDDGYYNNYLYAFEIAKKYGAKFIIAPIAYYSELYTNTPDENAYYSHATWSELKEMADSGLVEIQNHSYNLHTDSSGVKKKSGEDEDSYAQRIGEDILKAQSLIENAVGKAPQAFVYPFGAKSGGTLEIIKEMGFQCTLTCEEKVSTITRNPDSLYELGRFLRPAGVSSEEFFTSKLGGLNEQP